MEVRNNVNTNRMCRFEKKKIKVKLEEIIEDGEIKNAIYIYTERKLNHERWLTEGIGVILLLRKSVHNDIFFDIKRAILVPIIELISYRIDSILEKHNINTSFPHICWIPIYYINNKAVVIPVIRKCDVSLAAKSEGETIIINPFNE
ncbi:TPA: hypothetical protein RFV03_001115 [Klebsiella quasipneumoniae subsp. similipneumoniae]|nr:hypothetical protein [Klebsiella quasipneumoniae subsp. similipneumoniae]